VLHFIFALHDPFIDTLAHFKRIQLTLQPSLLMMVELAPELIDCLVRIIDPEINS
jgi:hypothetical protein